MKSLPVIDPFMGPAEVAQSLGIGTRQARQLMRTGAIKSQLWAETESGREYWRTTPTAVAAYVARTIPETPPRRQDPRTGAPMPGRIIIVE